MLLLEAGPGCVGADQLLCLSLLCAASPQNFPVSPPYLPTTVSIDLFS